MLAALLRTGAPLTGRQLHGLFRDQCSPWSVQQALASLVGLGVVTSRDVGRAMVHAINGDHYTIHLRARVDQHAHTRSFLKKAEEYPDSAQANLTAKRYTVAAGDAIHARICAKDAIVTELAGTTMNGKDHALAPNELWQAPGPRPDAASAEKGSTTWS